MKFKKQVALITAFLMLVSNTGFAMTVHYCGGKISSISSGFSNKEFCLELEAAPQKTCCAKTDDANQKQCCSDKTVNVKGKAIDVIVKMASVDYAVPFIVPAPDSVIFGYGPMLKTEKTAAYHCDANAPPLFKLYQKYILYA